MQVVRADLVFFRALGPRVPEAPSPGLTGSPSRASLLRAKRVGSWPTALWRERSRAPSGLTTVFRRLFPRLGAKDPWPPTDLASSTRHRLLSVVKLAIDGAQIHHPADAKRMGFLTVHRAFDD